MSREGRTWKQIVWEEIIVPISKEATEQLLRIGHQLKVKEIDKNFFSILCARMTIQSFLGCEVGIDSRMIKSRQKMIDILVPEDLKWSDDFEVEQRCYAELLVIMAQLNNGIKLANGNTLREQFARETTMEDWASFFRDYDMFGAWHKK